MSRRLTGVDDPGTVARVGGRPRADAVAHANVEAVRPLTNKASATSDSLSFGGMRQMNPRRTDAEGIPGILLPGSVHDSRVLLARSPPVRSRVRRNATEDEHHV